MRNETMVKIYVMETCPDCAAIKRQAEGRRDIELVDIGKNVRDLKEFLRLRDSDPVFDEVKANGSVGIPCFVLEDGTVTLSPQDAGFEPNEIADGASCNIDGSGC